MKKFLYTLTLAAAMSGMHVNAANNFSVTDVEGKPGETINIQIQLASDDAVAGYQVNLKADKEGLTLGTATVTGAATLEGAWIGSNAVSNTSYNLLCYSETCKTYANNTAKVVAVVPVTIPAGTAEGVYTFTLSNGVLSNAAGVAANCADGSFKVTVKAAGVENDINGDSTFDIKDVNTIFYYYSISSNDLKYDINGDGSFNIKDVNQIFYLYTNANK